MMFGARADSEPILPSGDGGDRTKTSAPASAPTTENGEHANESQRTTRENDLITEAIPSRGRFVQIDGSIGGSGYDETTVELVLPLFPEILFLYHVYLYVFPVVRHGKIKRLTKYFIAS
jgi:hypothetical protein